MDILDDIAAGVGFPFQQPAEDATAGRVLDAAAGSESIFEAGSIWRGSLPVAADPAVPDERTFVLAEEEPISSGHQHLARIVNERVRTRDAKRSAISRDAFIGLALD